MPGCGGVKAVGVHGRTMRMTAHGGDRGDRGDRGDVADAADAADAAEAAEAAEAGPACSSAGVGGVAVGDVAAAAAEFAKPWSDAGSIEAAAVTFDDGELQLRRRILLRVQGHYRIRALRRDACRIHDAAVCDVVAAASSHLLSEPKYSAAAAKSRRAMRTQTRHEKEAKDCRSLAAADDAASCAAVGE